MNGSPARERRVRMRPVEPRIATKMANQVDAGRRPSAQVLIMRELSPFFLSGVKMTGRPSLGVGAYGSVEELELAGLVCAGKQIHETLVDVGNEGADEVATRFVEECKLLSELRHPHVVQFLGLCLSPSSSLPILVMEHLHCSLDDLLESNPDIPLYMKRSILRDVALGLAHLHGRQPPIIHRDLTARNVLLDRNMKAKLADFGVARILNLPPGKLETTLTSVPGTSSYMPPEVFDREARYSTSVDIFSFGHMALFAATQVMPSVEAATYVDGSGRIIARSEIERREESLNRLYGILGQQHPFVEIVVSCLQNNPLLRPSIREVLAKLEQMKSRVRDPYFGLTRLTLTHMIRKKVAENKKMAADLQQAQSDLLNARKRIVHLTEELQNMGYYQNVGKAASDGMPHDYTYITPTDTAPLTSSSDPSATLRPSNSISTPTPPNAHLSKSSHQSNPPSSPDSQDSHQYSYVRSLSDAYPSFLPIPPTTPTRHLSHENLSNIGSDAETLKSPHSTSYLSLPSASRLTPMIHGGFSDTESDSDSNELIQPSLLRHSPVISRGYSSLPSSTLQSTSEPPASSSSSSSSFSPSTPQPLTMGMAGKLHFYTDLDSSSLFLLQNADIGKIPGVHYKCESGEVQIETESSDKTELAADKFRKAYMMVMQQKVSVSVDVAPDLKESTVDEIIASHSSQCALLYDAIDSSVQVLGLSGKEVMQAKISLEAALQKAAQAGKTTATDRQGASSDASTQTSKTVHLSARINLTVRIGDLGLEDAEFVVCPNSSNLACRDGPVKLVNELSHGLVARQCKDFITKHGLLGFGHSVVTKGGGHLKCKYIIHANSGVGSSGDVRQTLKRLVVQAVKMATQKGAPSIAFSPLVSAWADADIDVVAQTMITTLSEFAGQKRRQKLRDIRIIVQDQNVFDCFVEHAHL